MGENVTNEYIGLHARTRQSTYSYRTNLSQSEIDIPGTVYNDMSRKEGDTGHEFWTAENSLHPVGPDRQYFLMSNTSKSNPPFHRGGIQLQPKRSEVLNFFNGHTDAKAMSRNEILDYGQRAILGSSPTTQGADNMVTLMELLQRRPAIPGSDLKTQTNLARAAGSNYLNVVFGWQPLISDLRATVENLSKSSQILRQLMRDNKAVVRRGFSFPETRDLHHESSEHLTRQFLSPNVQKFPHVSVPWGSKHFGYSYPASMAEHPVTVNRTVLTKRKIWFRGAFTYYIPEDDGLMNELLQLEAKANVLLGTRLTPATVWELAPWSWLVDWAVKIGQSLDVASMLSSDSLVIRYGYLMATTERSTLVSSTQVPMINKGTTVWVKPRGYMLKSIRKERFRAQPYGFAVAEFDPTVRQAAILAALGMSRSKRNAFW